MNVIENIISKIYLLNSRKKYDTVKRRIIEMMEVRICNEIILPITILLSTFSQSLFVP